MEVLCDIGFDFPITLELDEAVLNGMANVIAAHNLKKSYLYLRPFKFGRVQIE